MLTTEQIIDLVERRRTLLREQMTDAIMQKNDKTRGYAATVAEFNSLDVLLLAIREGRMDMWKVAGQR